ncbi:hypothetical protein BIW11_02121, partial [Tropilaelaps mercedesae]
ESTESLLSKYGSFDVVFSLYALHWVRDLGQALRNVRRLLTPASSPRKQSSKNTTQQSNESRSSAECLLVFLALNPALLVYRDLTSRPRWAEHFNESHIPFGEIYTQRTLEELAEDNGLKLRSCEVLNLECRHASVETLRGVVSLIKAVTTTSSSSDASMCAKDEPAATAAAWQLPVEIALLGAPKWGVWGVGQRLGEGAPQSSGLAKASVAAGFRRLSVSHRLSASALVQGKHQGLELAPLAFLA